MPDWVFLNGDCYSSLCNAWKKCPAGDHHTGSGVLLTDSIWLPPRVAECRRGDVAHRRSLLRQWPPGYDECIQLRGDSIDDRGEILESGGRNCKPEGKWRLLPCFRGEAVSEQGEFRCAIGRRPVGQIWEQAIDFSWSGTATADEPDFVWLYTVIYVFRFEYPGKTWRGSEPECRIACRVEVRRGRYDRICIEIANHIPEGSPWDRRYSLILYDGYHTAIIAQCSWRKIGQIKF